MPASPQTANFRHRWAALLVAFAGCVLPVPRPMAARLRSADRALHRGQLERAEALIEQAGRAPGLGRPGRAEVWRLEGELRLQQRRPIAAAAAFERARAAAATAFGPLSREAREARLDVAEARAAGGSLAEAERIYREAATDGTIAKAELADRLEDLALLASTADRESEAERLYRSALELTEQAGGGASALMASRLADWALQLQRMDRLDEAEQAYRRALGILRGAFPPGHPRRDGALNALALFLESRGSYPEAEELYRRAIDEASGSGRTSESVRGYASMLRRLGREGEAAQVERRDGGKP